MAVPPIPQEKKKSDEQWLNSLIEKKQAEKVQNDEKWLNDLISRKKKEKNPFGNYKPKFDIPTVSTTQESSYVKLLPEKALGQRSKTIIEQAQELANTPPFGFSEDMPEPKDMTDENIESFFNQQISPLGKAIAALPTDVKRYAYSLTKLTAETFDFMTVPSNLAMILAFRGASAIPKIGGALERLAGAGFAGHMTYGIAKDLRERSVETFKEAMKNEDFDQAVLEAGRLGVHSLFAIAGGRAAVGPRTVGGQKIGVREDFKMAADAIKQRLPISVEELVGLKQERITNKEINEHAKILKDIVDDRNETLKKFDELLNPETYEKSIGSKSEVQKAQAREMDRHLEEAKAAAEFESISALKDKVETINKKPVKKPDKIKTKKEEHEFGKLAQETQKEVLDDMNQIELLKKDLEDKGISLSDPLKSSQIDRGLKKITDDINRLLEKDLIEPDDMGSLKKRLDDYKKRLKDTSQSHLPPEELDFLVDQGGAGLMDKITDRSLGIAAPEILPQGALNKMQSAITDQFAPIKKAVNEMLAGKEDIILDASKNPYDIAIATSKSASAKAKSWIDNGVTDLRGVVKTPSLKEIFKPVAKNVDSFLRYAYARRARDLWERDINPGITKEQANSWYERLDSPVFRKAADELNNFQKAVLEYWRDSGGLSEESFNAILDANPFYIPLKRMVDKTGTVKFTGPGRRFVDLPQVVRRIRGSEKPIQDPIESIIQNTEKILLTADRARVANALVDLAEKTGSPLVKRMKAPMDVRTRSLKELRSQLEKSGVDLKDADMESVISFFGAASRYYGKDNVVSVFRDGKREFFEVEPYLYNTLKGMDKITLRPAMNLIFGAPKRAVTLGATGLRAGFQLITNPIRDTLSALVQTELPFRDRASLPFRSLRALGQIAKNDPVWQRARARGIEIAQPLGYDRRFLRAVREEILATTPKEKVIHNLKHPIDGLRKVMSFTEAMNRLAEGAKVEKRLGTFTEEAQIRAAIAESEVSVNFKRAGYYSEVLNQAIPFFNPAIQGVSKFARTLNDRPLRSAIAAISTITAPSLAMWALNKDEEWYKEIPNYEKVLFMHFKMGDEIYRLPMPFECGMIFGAIPVSVAQSMYENNPEQFKDISKEVLLNTAPPIIPANVRPIIETYFNYDIFRDRPIVSEGKQRLIPPEQTTEFTPEIYNYLGRKWNVSPSKIRHMAESYSGGLIRDFASIPDLATGKYENGEGADLPIFGRLYSRQKRTGQSINDYFNELDRLQRIKSTIGAYKKQGRAKDIRSLVSASNYIPGKADAYIKAKKNIIELIKADKYKEANRLARKMLNLSDSMR